jgi:N-acetylmuramoyl-L-alanine amidase
VVIHYTVLDLAGTLARFADPSAEVSSHYVIAPDGGVHRPVAEERRAWHAGAGRWGDVTDVNSRSIGIELVNAGNHPFAAAQMAALEGLLPGVMARWGIGPARVIGHSDCAVTRKVDPGARFDWRRLARGGLAVRPGTGLAAGPRPAARLAAMGSLRAALTVVGYDPDAALDDVLQAFRLRFRPGVTGPADNTDLALAQDLAQRFPVDGRGNGA